MSEFSDNRCDGYKCLNIAVWRVLEKVGDKYYWHKYCDGCKPEKAIMIRERK